MAKDYETAVAEEAAAVKSYGELMAAKKSEIAALSKMLEDVIKEEIQRSKNILTHNSIKKIIITTYHESLKTSLTIYVRGEARARRHHRRGDRGDEERPRGRVMLVTQAKT